MIENSLRIILFFYIVSGFLLAGQVVFYESFGTILVNMDGEPIQSHIADLINEQGFNTATENIVSANYTTNSTFFDKIETFTTAAAYIAWELVTLLSGTYIFNIMFLMGVPTEFVAVFVGAYVLLLARAIIGYIRGI